MAGPYVEIPDALGQDLVSALLAFVDTKQDRFLAASVTDQGKTVTDPIIRVAHVCNEFEDELPTIRSSLEMRALGWLDRIGIAPFETYGNELVIVAHGDGAFFRGHIDTMTDADAVKRDRVRVASAVYYFHHQPKKFSGGALRIGALRSEDHVDIEPEHNKLVMFPSFVPHEVRRIHCPSGRFEDARFAINLWLCKQRG